MKKTVFIAHPIAGDIKDNTRKVLAICGRIHREEQYIPVVPYLVSLQYLNDDVTGDRELGIEANLETLRRGYVDELWLFGECISKGMEQEIKTALTMGIKVVAKTEGTRKDLNRFVWVALRSITRES